MIYIYRDHKLCETDSLIEAAGLAGWRHPAVCAAGAGGKTSVLRRLAAEYAKKGCGAAVTTTTHIKEEDLPWFLTETSEERMKEILARWRQVWIGIPGAEGKLGSVPEPFFSKICWMGIPVLIEADGARMLPLKCPGPNEPVIPPQTTHVLSVYGMDALGQRIENVCFRAERAAQLLNKQITEPVTAEDISVLASSEEAGRKGCPAGAVYTVVLNKADDGPRREQAEAICAMLERRGVRRIIVTSLIGGKDEKSPLSGRTDRTEDR